MVGLYLNKRDKALVLCVDEKRKFRSWTYAGGMRMKKGRAGKMKEDYKSNGKRLLEALNMLDGSVIGE